MSLVEKYPHRILTFAGCTVACGLTAQGAVEASRHGAWGVAGELLLVWLVLCAPLVVCSAYLFSNENH